MQLFYSPNINELFLDKEESRHCIKVLRLKENDEINIIDGRGGYAKAIIKEASEKKTSYEITNYTENYLPLPYSLHMVVAPTKNISRYEWFIEKATEIGITEITPVVCDNSERKIVKTDRLKKIIIAASKQSNKACFPVINELTNFSQFIKNYEHDYDLKVIAHCEDEDKRSLDTIYADAKKILICIGPEGDFSKSEIELALKNDFIPVTLGVSRLRTETAAVFSCAAISILYNKKA